MASGVQEGFALLHDKDLRTGLWVSYRLSSTDIDGASGRDRVNCFRKDPRLTSAETAILSDYDEPIYDRGHLANDADLKDNLIEQVNTYMLSNMSPQHCRFNRGVWLSLEHLGRIWAEEYGTIFLTSGAIFDFIMRDRRDRDDKAGRMGSRNNIARVAVPSDYYKIFLREDGNTVHSVDFFTQTRSHCKSQAYPIEKTLACQHTGCQFCPNSLGFRALRRRSRRTGYGFGKVQFIHDWSPVPSDDIQNSGNPNLWKACYLQVPGVSFRGDVWQMHKIYD